MSEWISVKNEMPKCGDVVLVKVYSERKSCAPKQDFICTAKMSLVTRYIGKDSPIDKRFYVYPSGGHEITDAVTHWMPLPEPPK